ncbi:hypothetical protein C2857_002098 [Epichloe festucae Fl1]|uniref:FAD linked oxidase N-terminal domain-containing protein n=1 Tax=Epichloe festucae (strain Fl1) TaxID=877507 RepID=A0A7S9KRN3_EPIFF|nr:hypothetical protein C2857_002098 [Epichloe festucae Fl1]
MKRPQGSTPTFGRHWPGFHISNGQKCQHKDIRSSGLFLPLDPGPTALIGGMVSTNCSGTNATRYGAMKDYVVKLTVVLADGSVIKTHNRPRKTSAGYNLNGLLTGRAG